MEALAMRHLVSLASENFLFRMQFTSTFFKGYPVIPNQTRRVIKQFGSSSFISCAKKSDFQDIRKINGFPASDFQSFARPLRLLQATEVNVCTESSLKEMSTSFSVDESQSFYKVKLHTSGVFDSRLSDLNAGILLCLIDVNGDSILQRIPATSLTDLPQHLNETTHSNLLHFQRGSIDEFTFVGPKLGQIEALWIGLESGCWRLDGVSLIVICGCQPQLNNTKEENGKSFRYSGLSYDFEAEDILLGEGSNMSMTELRPRLITESSGLDLLSLLNMEFSQTSPSSLGISNNESMKEYAELKFSLLIYDVMLIFAGTSIASFSAGDKAALAFLTGGVGGFLYLLLLQKSVDGLPAPASISMNREGENLKQLIGGLKGPISILALALAFVAVAVKYGSGDALVVLTPKELMVGMMGFLVCKIAVVLAAFKPVPMGLKENK